jgi:phospholipid transport system substrate-binding protein
MTLDRSFAILCCALSLFLAPARAHAAAAQSAGPLRGARGRAGRPARAHAAAAQSATAAVKASNEKLRASLRSFYKSKGPARETARAQARAAVGGLLDFNAFAKATLGKRWETLSPAERARYTNAMRGAMEANYLAKMQSGNVDVGQVKTEVLGEERRGDQTIVKTTIHSGSDTASVDYVMERGPGGPRAVDVITEGVSLVETYRDQINTLYPKKGLNGVIEAFDRVRKRAEKTQDAEADKQGASATGAAGAGSTAGAGDGAPAEGAKAQQTQPGK